MRPILCQIMADDTIRQALRSTYQYDRGLGRVVPDDADPVIITSVSDDGGSFKWLTDFFEWLASLFADLIELISAIPSVVWVVVCVVIVAVVATAAVRLGLIGTGYKLPDMPLDDDDDIYAPDMDMTLVHALAAGDYSAALRLRYLQVLRWLADSGRVAWQRHKTPAQFAAEAGIDGFRTMTYYFLRVRYGKYPASRSLYELNDRLAAEIMKGGAA